MNPSDDPAAEAVGVTRLLLDDLLAKSRLYKTGKDYRDLLDFVARLRNFAPFNAMLLQVQKPGLRFAASEHDWRERFARTLKPRARPLLILWPFGPVALVYDLLDTEGREPLPEDVASFVARGEIDEQKMARFPPLLTRKNIEWLWMDSGDQQAGFIKLIHRATQSQDANRYRIDINKNHDRAVQFNTLVHELGHLFLGHLGPDAKLRIPERSGLSHAQRELEAESVAYIVCRRNSVEPKSEPYLANFVSGSEKSADIAVYQVMRAAGQIETLLDLARPTNFDGPLPRASVGAATASAALGFQPKFNPKVAAQIMQANARRQRLKQVCFALLLIAVGVATTVTVYEIRNSYENCILRSVPGTPANALRLIHESCRRISR